VKRFATLAKILPFLPVFGGGTSRFQPVHVGDIALLVEIISRGDPDVLRAVAGKIVEAGGPDGECLSRLFYFAEHGGINFGSLLCSLHISRTNGPCVEVFQSLASDCVRALRRRNCPRVDSGETTGKHLLDNEGTGELFLASSSYIAGHNTHNQSGRLNNLSRIT
jgi:hypothetical protein